MSGEDEIKALEPIWGAWYIKHKLGEGGFGTVYEIERKEFGNTFLSALKVMSIPQNPGEYKEAMSEGMNQEETTEYFRDMVMEMTKEFALMDTVKGHTNIVDYADHLVLKRSDGMGWNILIRMELLTSLNDYIIEHPMLEEDVLKLGMDMCRALEVCEKHIIIHRDIKPGNIFISKSGDYKLGDFGIARVAEKTKGASTKVGTKSYLAPEIYKEEKYGKSVDIYSLGLVMYRFLNHGRFPFFPPFPEKITFADKENALQKRMQGVEEIPLPDCEDKELAGIVKKACSYRTEDRYESAEQMYHELEQILWRKKGWIDGKFLQPSQERIHTKYEKELQGVKQSLYGQQTYMKEKAYQPDCEKSAYGETERAVDGYHKFKDNRESASVNSGNQTYGGSRYYPEGEWKEKEIIPDNSKKTSNSWDGNTKLLRPGWKHNATFWQRREWEQQEKESTEKEKAVISQNDNGNISVYKYDFTQDNVTGYAVTGVNNLNNNSHAGREEMEIQALRQDVDENCSWDGHTELLKPRWKMEN